MKRARDLGKIFDKPAVVVAEAEEGLEFLLVLVTTFRVT
jgi:hypothetical protein